MKEIAIQCQYIIHFLQLKKRRNFVHKSLQFSPSWSNFVMFFSWNTVDGCEIHQFPLFIGFISSLELTL